MKRPGHVLHAKTHFRHFKLTRLREKTDFFYWRQRLESYANTRKSSDRRLWNRKLAGTGKCNLLIQKVSDAALDREVLGNFVGEAHIEPDERFKLDGFEQKRWPAERVRVFGGGRVQPSTGILQTSNQTEPVEGTFVKAISRQKTRAVSRNTWR